MNDGRMDSARFRLSWGECDPAGIVYFAAYLPWMERLHSGWWFERGLRFDEMAERFGASVVTRQVTCDYLRPARVLDPIEVTMSLLDVGTRSYQLWFEFRRTDGDELVASARLEMVFVGADGAPAPIPHPVLAVLDDIGRLEQGR
jgi:YbgC/YbaW family acyl-CoA thioester hydrolase